MRVTQSPYSVRRRHTGQSLPNMRRAGPNTSRARSRYGRISRHVPRRAAHLGDHAGQLAGHVRTLGDVAKVARPRLVEASGGDRRLGDVVEHEGLRRVPIDEGDRGRQLRRVDQHVVHEAVCAQPRDAAIERRAGPGTRGRARPARRAARRRSGPRRRTAPAPSSTSSAARSTHPTTPRIAATGGLRLREQEVVLGERLPRLHGHRAVEPGGVEFARQVGVQVVAPQGRRVGRDPVVLDRIEAPEVLVSVDLHDTAYSLRPA